MHVDKHTYIHARGRAHTHLHTYVNFRDIHEIEIVKLYMNDLTPSFYGTAQR